MNQSVSYKTPLGYFHDSDQAATSCEQAGLDPHACIQPNVSPTDVTCETAYGTTFRLSQPVRVF